MNQNDDPKQEYYFTRPESTPTPSQSPSSSGKQIAISFVNLNEETGPKQDMDTRHMVRAHVMRDFQRKKQQRSTSDPIVRQLLPRRNSAGVAHEFEMPQTSDEFVAGMQNTAYANTPINPVEGSLYHVSSWTNTASSQALQFTNHDPSAVLQLKRDTINFINNRLADPVQSTSDECINAVATLVLLESEERNVELSNLHMDGLARMIDLKGGLEALETSIELRRKVIWADLCNANLSGQEPRFSFVQEHDDLASAHDQNTRY